ncbi:MAG: response regulator [Candidatus Eisenbacteria bacterium]|nr:response regulator [Candidatus Eisenbacteria bacterium]
MNSSTETAAVTVKAELDTPEELDSRALLDEVSQSPTRVLVVDDEENVREIFLELFREKGHEADSANTGEEALRKINETEYDLVLTDINLPGVDGLEVVKAVKAKNETTCVIVITGYASTRTAIDALRHGAYDYVTKPFDLWEVAQTIDRGLSSCRLTAENQLLLQRLKVANEELKQHKETLIEKIELATRRLRTLYEFGKEITSSLSLGNTCSSITEKARALILCDTVFLFLFDENSSQYSTVAGSGVENLGISEVKCSPSDGFPGTALSLETPTVHTRPKILGVNGEYAPTKGPGACLVVPLSTLGERIGGLLLARAEEKPFSQEDMEMLSLFGRQAAIALSNARLYEKTKELDRLKSEFVAVVSHELRTPLTSMKGSIDLLQDERLFKPSETQKELLGICDANATRLIKLVSDILDFSKMDSSKLSMDFEPIDVVEVLRQCIRNIEGLAKQKNLGILADLPGQEVIVEADGARIEQVVTNLLGNAIKFSEAQSKVSLSFTARENEIEVGVRDQGSGIAVQDIKKLFKKFQQLDGSMTRKVGGTGLGLVISKGIIEQHHGRIWVESEIGKGSLFAFAIPLKQPGAEGQAAIKEIVPLT